MFRWITTAGLCGTAGLIVLHAILFPCGHGDRLSVKGLIRRKVHLFTLLFLEQRLTALGRIRKLIYLLAVFTVFVLAATGFWPVLTGGRIAGWLLMIHATFGGVFIFCIAFLTLTWSQRFVFGKNKRLLSCGLEDFILKAGFWVMVLLSLPTALSMVLSMFPLFGAEGQETLLWIHRCSALGFLTAAMFETYFAVRREILKDIAAIC
jgi:hypothetical protein